MIIRQKESKEMSLSGKGDGGAGIDFFAHCPRKRSVAT